MRKVLTTAISLLLSCTRASAGQASQPKFTFGAEWGYIGTFFSGHHYNYYAPEGFRVDNRGNEFTYYSNAEAYLHAGYNLSETYNISVYLGFSAVEDYHHTIPISIRVTRFCGGDHMKDRPFAFIDLGSGASVKSNPQMILTGKAGCGYRLSLSRDTKLDFIAAWRILLTHPDIYYYGMEVSPGRINRNNAYISAISLGMALSF